MSPVMRVLAAVLFAAALSSTAQASPEQEAANKAAVLAFYEKGLNQKDADAALRYLGDRYVQHNPNAADGPEGFRKFVAFLRDKYPQSRSEIKRVFTDGDYVILHVHRGARAGHARQRHHRHLPSRKGRIVEHWDAVQPIPEQSANGNGMF